MLDPRKLDLRKLNSATKYPSILTYHALGTKGRLTEDVQVDFSGQRVFASEKVDGTNTRVIVFGGSQEFIVGSRNDLLWFSEDLLYNPSQGIVETMAPIVHDLPMGFETPLVRVYYGEVYGGKVGQGAKQYSKDGVTGFRLFDEVEFDETDLLEVLDMDVEAIARWRENGGQPFCPMTLLERRSIEGIELTPRVEVGEVPTGLAETLEWLEAMIPESRARLDPSGVGEPEGLVLRTNDRKLIAKARFDDYRRTLRKR